MLEIDPSYSECWIATIYYQKITFNLDVVTVVF